jgi:glutamate carboxypeptidase
MLDTERMLSGIRRWVEIETPTGALEPLGRLTAMVEAEARDAGLATARVGGPEGEVLVARSEGADRPGLLVLAHLDTVHPVGTLAGNPWRAEGEAVYGPGAYDMKSGAYMALAAWRLLREDGRAPGLPLAILFVTDEEIGSPGARPVIERMAEDARFTLVVEPARDGGKVVTARKGVARFVVRTRGRPSHSGSRPRDGRSAIREMAHQVLALEALSDLDRGLTVNVGRIAGGTAPNVVPEHCRIEVDMRLPTLALAEEALAAVHGLRPRDPDVELVVEGGMTRPPFDPSPESLALFERAQELGRGFGLELEGCHTGGGSDGNFTAAKGVPTLDGLGADGDGAHTLDERIYPASLVPRTRLLAALYESLR